MQAQHGLLIFRLRRYCAHSRLLHRRPNCARVGCIGLVRLHEGANELRMEEHHLVPQRSDLACPPMRAAAALQCDATRRSCARNRISSSRPNLRFKISPVSASTQYIWNTRFATSSPYVVASISDLPFLKWSVSKLHFGTSMRSVRRGPFVLWPPKRGRCPYHLGRKLPVLWQWRPHLADGAPSSRRRGILVDRLLSRGKAPSEPERSQNVATIWLRWGSKGLARMS